MAESGGGVCCGGLTERLDTATTGIGCCGGCVDVKRTDDARRARSGRAAKVEYGMKAIADARVC